jgi:hypothetical protein
MKKQEEKKKIQNRSVEDRLDAIEKRVVRIDTYLQTQKYITMIKWGIVVLVVVFGSVLLTPFIRQILEQVQNISNEITALQAALDGGFDVPSLQNLLNR